jgi:hypothetical protein
MTSLDTNILAAMSSQNAATRAIAQAALAKVTAHGPVCMCGPVFAELLGIPGRNPQSLRQMSETLGIPIEWGMEESDWVTAGLAYQGYVRRRLASSGGLPRLLLTDFLIGAHATVRGYALLTLDKRLYDAAFPGLRVVI